MEIGKEKLLLKGRPLACTFTEDGDRLIGCGAHSEVVPAWSRGSCGLGGFGVIPQERKGTV